MPHSTQHTRAPHARKTHSHHTRHIRTLPKRFSCGAPSSMLAPNETDWIVQNRKVIRPAATSFTTCLPKEDAVCATRRARRREGEEGWDVVILWEESCGGENSAERGGWAEHASVGEHALDVQNTASWKSRIPLYGHPFKNGMSQRWESNGLKVTVFTSWKRWKRYGMESFTLNLWRHGLLCV